MIPVVAIVGAGVLVGHQARRLHQALKRRGRSRATSRAARALAAAEQRHSDNRRELTRLEFRKLPRAMRRRMWRESWAQL